MPVGLRVFQNKLFRFSIQLVLLIKTSCFASQNKLFRKTKQLVFPLDLTCFPKGRACRGKTILVSRPCETSIVGHRD